MSHINNLQNLIRWSAWNPPTYRMENWLFSC